MRDERVDDGRAGRGPGRCRRRTTTSVRADGMGVPAEQVLDDLLAPGRRQVRVGQRVAQLVAALEGAGEAEQLVLDDPEAALGPGDVEHGLGVGADPIGGLGRLGISCSVPDLVDVARR